MKALAGKVVVITGGGSGIGRATALALAEAGMNVVVADINPATAKSVAAELVTEKVQAIAVETDVSDEDSVNELARRAYEEFGAVHVLHNNAGIGAAGRIDATSSQVWKRVLAVNVGGVINGLNAFLSRMKAQGGEAHIVNSASMAGLVATPGLGAYNATKYAVVAISETLRWELAPAGIGVSVLCPGPVATNMSSSRADKEAPGGTADLNLPSLRRLEAEDVGRMVRYGILNNEPYIFTHPELDVTVRRRFERILAAYAQAATRDASAAHVSL